ncbi:MULTISPECIES: DUF3078 domain-containing protein [Olivibacter]|jgi:hypothetical protein|uniref:DUF3078 domain-containing protein n=2 Tax=Olivibacter TaxID=376469 RepID=A0ABV6HQ64_9SPHI|nr:MULTISPECIES: DUF3078 domain-containing protein [Olivibacter]MCL4640120.1 DUF3078 domain-containing protein [Olivibacter sp. UJ_SKK_5.1]MDX3917304.1 DUF3078 domain-containing protein [Pseudosphingobacterium sp.]QEL04007.1 DUF3078 domain-containing protein [Olivibacter sp. LS-1]
MKKVVLLTSLFVSLLCCLHAQETNPDSIWKIHGENTFLINQSTFSNWAAGGINSLSANLVLNYDFNYKKDKWSWDNKVLAAYGLTKQKDLGWRKNDDRILLNSLLGYQAAPKWLYTFFMNFNSQFANGYNYNADGSREALISAGLAPAYLSFGPGIAYKESDNFRFNLSPASPRFVFVTNQELADQGAFGVDPGKKSRFEFGASFDAYYRKNIMENIGIENILRLYSNYLEDPKNVDVDYTLNIFMKVNRFVSVNAGVQMIYDDNTDVPKERDGVNYKGKGLQVKQIFGAGFTYKF